MKESQVEALSRRLLSGCWSCPQTAYLLLPGSYFFKQPHNRVIMKASDIIFPYILPRPHNSAIQIAVPYIFAYFGVLTKKLLHFLLPTSRT